MTRATVGGNHVAVYIPQAKGQPAHVKVFHYPDVETCIASKSFFKSSECKLLWNVTNTALLLWTTTEVDRSGKSYYGEAGLYFMNIRAKTQENVILKQEGPVHDVTWSPDGKHFVVVYGFMPATVTLFDSRGQPIADLGTAPRNTAKFSPDGRILCVAGFGNLQGQIDFWDHKKLAKIGTASAHMSAHYEWSPNSEYLVTGVLTPRMTVDNGWRVIHYSGKEVASGKCDELWELHWRPTFYRAFTQHPIPEAFYNQPAVSTEKKKAVYRPPGAAGRAGFQVRKDDDGPKKYEASKPVAHPTASPKAEKPPPPALVGDDQPAVVKKKKAKGKGASNPNAAIEQNKAKLNKTLRQIDDLKIRRENGAKLNAQQLALLKTEEAVLKELASLSPAPATPAPAPEQAPAEATAPTPAATETTA